MVGKNKRVKIGAPFKPESKKILANHLRPDQWDRILNEAEKRNNMPAWEFVRWCLDVAFTALDKRDGDVDGSAMFDDTLAEPHKAGVK